MGTIKSIVDILNSLDHIWLLLFLVSVLLIIYTILMLGGKPSQEIIAIIGLLISAITALSKGTKEKEKVGEEKIANGEKANNIEEKKKIDLSSI